MKKSFLACKKPLLTVMLKQTTEKGVFDEVKKALIHGADAFGLQSEQAPIFHQEDALMHLLNAIEDKPLYITNYKHHINEDVSYEEIAEKLLWFADRSITLCDVMGDFYCKDKEELTFEPDAVKKQINLIDKIHQKGAEVIMSSHINKFKTADEVLAVALEHQRRGADISKIVTAGDSNEEEIENLRITNYVSQKLDIPLLYLSGGTHCKIHRNIGILLGSCMSLCVCDNSNLNTVQPFVGYQKAIRDTMNFEV